LCELILLLSAFHFSLALTSGAALQSGVYQTLAGATVVESGDRVTNETRVVPMSAILKFDLAAAQPSLTAEIPNAVLEGGDPFPLTVHSLSGAQQMDGSFKFSGDYLRDIYPSGTQYLYDWNFSASTNETVLWNGIIGWAGGHFWQITISNLTLVPVPWLNISRVGNASVQITWMTNFPNHLLEYSTNISVLNWNIVTNAVTMSGDRFYVTLNIANFHRFYRLRKSSP
jgi:hypothetical protein